MITIAASELDLRTLNGRDHPAHVSGYRLEKCEVMGTMLASRRPGEWRTIRDCAAVKCRQYNCLVSGTAIENCLLDTMGQAGPLYFSLAACVFRQVTLRGRLTSMLFRFGTHRFSDARADDAWLKEMVKYYRDVDWAMDVREACFTALTALTIVPGDLVRYNPERAIRIRRNALLGDWATGMPSIMQICCEDFLEGPFDSFIVQRGETKANRDRFAAEADWMRANGFADPT